MGNQKTRIQKQKEEAINRMQMLQIAPEVIKQFADLGTIHICEPPVGTFTVAKGEDLQKIREFEKQYRSVVYLVIRSYTGMGKMDAYLHVSSYTEEWPENRRFLSQLSPDAYVYNHDFPDFSEFGAIKICRSFTSGLLRVW